MTGSVRRLALAVLVVVVAVAGALIPMPRAGAVASPVGTAAPEYWRWVVPLLRADEPDGSQAQFCAGSVISAEWVLTAAHCVVDQQTGRQVHPQAIQVGIGADLAGLEARVPIDRVVVYPRYSPRRWGRDVALIRMAAPPGVPAARIASLEFDDDEALLAGWGEVEAGLPTQLLVGVSSVFSRDACRHGLRSPWGTICATVPDSLESAACSGDSGGPLTDYRRETPEILGVVSYGPASCRAGNSTVYADARFYKPWIGRVMAGRSARVGLPEASSVYVRDEGRRLRFKINFSQAGGTGHRVKVTFVARPVSGRGKAIWREITGYMPRGGAVARTSFRDVYANGVYVVSVKITDYTAGVSAYGPKSLLRIR